MPDVSVVRGIGAVLPAHWRAAPTTAAGTGLRPGELFGLQVADIDFYAGRSASDRQLNDKREIAPLKIRASYRTLRLSQVVADGLAAHLAEGPRTSAW